MEFIWYDYEAWGKNPRVDRPAQVAAIRTDENLEQIGREVQWYCIPREDCVISPKAVSITGITPQYAFDVGISEAEFARKIHETLTSRPDTCVVGYNAMRFDHELTRLLLYRNLRDPYKWHWADGNARWDLYHLIPAVYLLRPDVFKVWPKKDNGQPSFRLADLVRANVENPSGPGHDALADTRNLLELARIIRERSPQLFAFGLNMVRKEHVREECRDNFLFISQRLPGKGRLATILARLGPVQKEGWFWAFDLAHSPERLQKPLASWNDEDHKKASRWIFRVKTHEAPFVRHCPFPVASAAQSFFTKIGLSGDQLELNLSRLERDRASLEAYCADKEEKWEERQADFVDPDEALYSGGFWIRYQQEQMMEVLEADDDVSRWNQNIDDPRLEALTFRYRARNFPECLTLEQQERWRAYCHRRQFEARGKYDPIEKWNKEIAELKSDPAKASLACDLEEWREQLKSSLQPN